MPGSDLILTMAGIVLMFYAAVIYTLYKFRKDKQPKTDGSNTSDNTEVIETKYGTLRLNAFILIFVGGALLTGAGVYLSLNKKADPAVAVNTPTNPNTTTSPLTDNKISEFDLTLRFDRGEDPSFAKQIKEDDIEVKVGTDPKKQGTDYKIEQSGPGAFSVQLLNVQRGEVYKFIARTADGTFRQCWFKVPEPDVFFNKD